jgi:hypothetical protein
MSPSVISTLRFMTLICKLLISSAEFMYHVPSQTKVIHIQIHVTWWPQSSTDHSLIKHNLHTSLYILCSVCLCNVLLKMLISNSSAAHYAWTPWMQIIFTTDWSLEETWPCGNSLFILRRDSCLYICWLWMCVVLVCGHALECQRHNFQQLM